MLLYGHSTHPPPANTGLNYHLPFFFVLRGGGSRFACINRDIIDTDVHLFESMSVHCGAGNKFGLADSTDYAVCMFHRFLSELEFSNNPWGLGTE